MRHFFPGRAAALALAVAAAWSLTGCGDGASAVPEPTVNAAVVTAMSARYEITLVNLTAGQPLTPLLVAAHGEPFQLFEVGSVPGVAFERLAESGDAAALLAESAAAPMVYASAVASGGPLFPVAGNHAALALEVPLNAQAGLRLSAVSMLANTNDAFAGVAGLPLHELEVGGTLSTYLVAYDAGTERNTESAATMPGPATHGEGFNGARDDVVKVVHVHPGVISRDAGLAGSALTLNQRWDNPVASLTITRVR